MNAEQRIEVRARQYPRLPDVSSQYGAPMGRRESRPTDPNVAARFHLCRVHFVDGDYDSGGAYWGGGPGTRPLYQAMTEEDRAIGNYGRADDCHPIELYIRADNREAAKAAILRDYPRAMFYR